MELIPKEIEATLPPLYSQENVSDPVAVVKLFGPCCRYTFYVLEVHREPPPEASDWTTWLDGACLF